MTTANQLSTPAETSDLSMSADEFEAWVFAQPEEGRYEWAHGQVIAMAPANLDHVDLNGWLCTLLRLSVGQRDLGVV